jgi:uncharacterized integral membrane protein
MMIQSIIVYRNPMEAAFWESASSGAIFPIIVGIIVFFAVFLIVHAQVVERFYSWRRQAWPSYINLFVSACAGCAVIYKMWI